MLAQETEIIEIDEEQLYEAKMFASALSTEQIRKRSLIDYLGINCARQYLLFKRIKVDNKRRVYKIPFLFEEFKISDLYCGNHRIDVITLFKEKTIKIPKIHVDMEILPNFYLIIQIGSKIKEAKIIGFIDSKSVLNSSHDSKYFYPTLDTIFGVEKFSILIKRSVSSKTMIGKHIDCIGLFLKFIDNDLSSIYKKQLIQHLMNCDSCRARFIDAVEFEKLAGNIRYYPQLIKKYTAQNGGNDDSEMSLEDAISSKNDSKNAYIGENSKVTFFDAKNADKNEVDNSYSTDENNFEKLKVAQMLDIPSKNAKNLLTKKVLSTIFNEIPKIELPAIKTMMQAKNKRAIMVVISVFFILGSFALISVNSVNEALEEKRQMEEVDEYNSNDYSFDYDLAPADNKTAYDEYTIKQPVSTKPTYSPTINKVSWEASQTLVKKDAVSKYLMMSGKNIKLNLQNDLLLINDVPTSGQAMVEIILARNGNVLGIDIIQSSGSRVIDETIKKVIIDTLRNMKPPAIGGDSENSLILKLTLN